MTSMKARMTGRMPGRIAALVLASVAVAGCTAAAATQTLQGSTSPTASPTASPSLAASATPTSLPSAANGASINWTMVAAGPSSLPSPDPNSSYGWTILGWSRGWLAFLSVDAIVGGQMSMTVETRHSQDGLHWQAGGQVQWDWNGDVMGVSNVVEGPAGLLAYNREVLGWGNVDAPLAVSVDGNTWRSIKAGTLPDSIQNISGGSTGYVATGTDGVFTSVDGMTWSRAALTGTAFNGLDRIENGVAFADGYVLVGEACGSFNQGCGAGLPTPLTPTLWWSPDGKAWTRDSISGTIVGSETTTQVYRLDDHHLLECESNATEAVASWASNDGRTWTKVSTLDTAGVAFVTNGKRTVIVSAAGSGSLIRAFRDDLTLTTLVQTGDVPNSDHMFGWVELGPNGLLQMDDLGNTYLGVPIAG